MILLFLMPGVAVNIVAFDLMTGSAAAPEKSFREIKIRQTENNVLGMSPLQVSLSYNENITGESVFAQRKRPAACTPPPSIGRSA